MDLATETEVNYPDTTAHTIFPLWTPDDRYLVVNTGGYLGLVATDGSGFRRLESQCSRDGRVAGWTLRYLHRRGRLDRADPYRRWGADRVAHRRGGRQRELAAEPVSHSPGRSPTGAGPARTGTWFTVRLGRAQLEADELTVVPANEAAWDDLQTVFGNRGDAPLCQCQRYKLRPKEAFSKFPAEERAARLLAQTHFGDPDANATTGLVAYLDGEPVGWCAVEPRTAYPGLLRVYRVPWEGRAEDKTDDSVWAATCVSTRAGYRRRGISRALVGPPSSSRGAAAPGRSKAIRCSRSRVRTSPGARCTLAAVASSPTPVSRRSATRPCVGW